MAWGSHSDSWLSPFAPSHFGTEDAMLLALMLSALTADPVL